MYLKKLKYNNNLIKEVKLNQKQIQSVPQAKYFKPNVQNYI